MTKNKAQGTRHKVQDTRYKAQEPKTQNPRTKNQEPNKYNTKTQIQNMGSTHQVLLKIQNSANGYNHTHTRPIPSQ
jgi:hypothetical protein